MGGFKNIVIVDDDQQSRMILEKYIKSVDGYNPIPLSSGIELIEYCKTSTPDIILLDIEMPNVSGIQAFSMIRAMSNMDGVPVVFCALADRWRAVSADHFALYTR